MNGTTQRNAGGRRGGAGSLPSMRDPRQRALLAWAGWLLVVIGAGHLVIFAIDAAMTGHVAGWLTGDLRTTDVLTDPISQSEAKFWVVLGSCAVPMALLALLVLRLAKAGLAAPPFVAYGMAGWILVCSLIIEPSGFPLGLIPAALLLRADRLQRRPVP